MGTREGGQLGPAPLSIGQTEEEYLAIIQLTQQTRQAYTRRMAPAPIGTAGAPEYRAGDKARTDRRTKEELVLTIKRVVTDHRADGKSIVASNGEETDIEVPGYPVLVSHPGGGGRTKPSRILTLGASRIIRTGFPLCLICLRSRQHPSCGHRPRSCPCRSRALISGRALAVFLRSYLEGASGALKWQGTVSTENSTQCIVTEYVEMTEGDRRSIANQESCIKRESKGVRSRRRRKRTTREGRSSPPLELRPACWQSNTLPLPLGRPRHGDGTGDKGAWQSERPQLEPRKGERRSARQRAALSQARCPFFRRLAGDNGWPRKGGAPRVGSHECCDSRARARLEIPGAHGTPLDRYLPHGRAGGVPERRANPWPLPRHYQASRP